MILVETVSVFMSGVAVGGLLGVLLEKAKQKLLADPDDPEELREGQARILERYGRAYEAALDRQGPESRQARITPDIVRPASFDRPLGGAGRDLGGPR